jgi:hypothetical protein
METPKEAPKSKLKAVLAVAFFVFILWFYFGGGLEKKAAQDLDKIELQVAQDAVKRYEMAKRSGTAMDAYVNAGLVCASFLQAGDEVNYKKWKVIEAQEKEIAFGR